MKVVAPLALAFTLSLIVSGCNQASTPAQAPLAPQFGTAGDDYVEQLAVDENGVYLGVQQNERPALVKFSRKGGISWTRSLGKSGYVLGVALSQIGDVYALYRNDDTGYAIGRYTQAGTLLGTRKVTGLDGVNFYIDAYKVDAQDNVYVAFSTYGTPRTAELRKYSSDGTLRYRKQLRSGANFAVTPDGTTYTISNARLTRYTSQGQQVWQKTLPFASEIALGSNNQIYVSGYDPTYDTDRILLAKYSSSGDKKWQRTLREGFFSSLQGLDADTEGHVFVGVGDRDDPYGNGAEELFFHSYDAAGTQLAKRTLDLGSGDHQEIKIRALSATEVYVAGTTFGGDAGGFLVRLNGLTGAVTWQR